MGTSPPHNSALRFYSYTVHLNHKIGEMGWRLIWGKYTGAVLPHFRQPAQKNSPVCRLGESRCETTRSTEGRWGGDAYAQCGVPARTDESDEDAGVRRRS